MTEVISQQRKDAVENAAAQLADWKRQQQAVTDTQGMGSLIAVQDVPPDIFLQQAQSGISTNYEASATYAGLITAAAGTALATGVAASTLSSFTVVTAAMVSHFVAMSAGIAAGLEGAGAVAARAKIAAASATAAGGLGGAAATFFIVAPLIAVVAGVTAGVVAAVNVANANDYDKKMNEAVAAAQKPMTTADLKAMLSSEGGQKTAYLSLVGQVAKNAADKKAMN